MATQKQTMKNIKAFTQQVSLDMTIVVRRSPKNLFKYQYHSSYIIS